MTSGGDNGNTRNPYGPRMLSALMPALVRPAFKRRAPATAQVLADWDTIMGPAIAAVTTPRKLFTGTLVIGCSGPIALELQHLTPQIIERINSHLGSVAVTRLRFVQEHQPLKPVAKKPRVLAHSAAKAAVAGMAESPLRDALESLGRLVLAPKRD